LLAKRVAEKYNSGRTFSCGDCAGAILLFVTMARRIRGGMSHCPLPCGGAGFFTLLADGVWFADVTKVIQSLGIAEITSFEAADLFRGKMCQRENIR